MSIMQQITNWKRKRQSKVVTGYYYKFGRVNGPWISIYTVELKRKVESVVCVSTDTTTCPALAGAIFKVAFFQSFLGLKISPANCDNKGLTKMMLFAFASGALLCANRNHQLLIINPKTKTKLLLTTMPFFLLFPRLHSIIPLFHFPPNFS